LEEDNDSFPHMIASAPYLRWAKVRPRVTYDLASSGLVPVSTEELLGDAPAKIAFEISGPNDDGYGALREAIGRRYGMTADRVSIANGAAGANFLVCLSLLRRGDDVLIELPAYDPLIAAVRVAGANVVHFERRREHGFALDPEAIRRAVTPATRLIVISNAHNPSGAMAGPEILDAIGRIADQAGAYVLVDEVYAEAQHDDGPVPQPAAGRGDRFVTTNSLTKAYGLAGLRCGWILASPDLSQRIRETRDVVDGSGPFVAERLALTAFEQIDRLRERARALFAENLATLRQMAAASPRIEWLEPQAGSTVFPRVIGVDDTASLVERLIRDYDTVAVPGHFFQQPQHLRVSFSGRPEMVREAARRLQRALGGGS
jgi:aspartate/methionine/tyrosine aminotransferase